MYQKIIIDTEKSGLALLPQEKYSICFSKYKALKKYHKFGQDRILH